MILDKYLQIDKENQKSNRLIKNEEINGSIKNLEIEYLINENNTENSGRLL